MSITTINIQMGKVVTDIPDLPDELFAQIISLLNGHDAERCALASRGLRDIVKELYTSEHKGHEIEFLTRLSSFLNTKEKREEARAIERLRGELESVNDSLGSLQLKRMIDSINSITALELRGLTREELLEFECPNFQYFYEDVMHEHEIFCKFFAIKGQSIHNLRELVQHLEQRCRMVWVLQVVQRICSEEHPDLQAHALLEIYKYLKGDNAHRYASQIIDDGIDKASRIANNYLRDFILGKIAAACVEWGDYNKAISATRKMTERKAAQIVLRDLAQTLAQSGQMDSAAHMLKQIPMRNQERILREVSLALIERDQISEAMQLADRVRPLHA